MWDFIKYHGLGNDFILLNGGMSGRPDPGTAEVRALCARGTGIGADGVMLARPSDDADLSMTLINRDGTIPEMCGNGLRCLVKYAVDDLGLTANPLQVATGAGVLSCRWRRGVSGAVDRVEVAMGAPTFDREEIPMTGQGLATQVAISAAGHEWTATGVGTGNPHMVLFGDHTVEMAREWGPVLTVHPMWPRGTNVEFTRVLSPTHLEVTVWERGCGLTAACGTGATAATAAAVKLGYSPPDTPITVTLLGGDLIIRVAADLRQAWMDGPAVETCRGQRPESPPSGSGAT
ncbi:MAG: diaminopimelate epimerase [Myxococcota bacterium]|jgi:diaminopimelate epimerase|nr:diaminopimelate epimerase [Myxococcota bacterium]